MLWSETVERKGSGQGWVSPTKIVLPSPWWSLSLQWHLLFSLLWWFRKFKPNRILRLSQWILFHAKWRHAFNQWVEFTPSFRSNWWLRIEIVREASPASYSIKSHLDPSQIKFSKVIWGHLVWNFSTRSSIGRLRVLSNWDLPLWRLPVLYCFEFSLSLFRSIYFSSNLFSPIEGKNLKHGMCVCSLSQSFHSLTPYFFVLVIPIPVIIIPLWHHLCFPSWEVTLLFLSPPSSILSEMSLP